MKKFRKVLSLICAMAFLTMLLAACGQSGSSKDQGTTQAPTTQAATTAAATQAPAPATLRFSWWGGDARHEATLAAVDAYMKLNPHIKIEAEYGGFDGYEQKLKTQLASGTAADVMQVDQPWLFELTSRGDIFVDLAAQSSFDSKTFDESFLKDFCTFNGKLVGVPTGINAMIAIVNKTLADKLGFAISDKMDAETLTEQIKKLRETDKKYYLMNYDGQSHYIMGLIQELVGKPAIKDDFTLGFTKEDAAKAYQRFITQVEAGYYEPIGEAALFSSKPEQNPKWINQEILMTTDFTSNMKRNIEALPKDVQLEIALPVVSKDSKIGASIVRPAQIMSVNINSAAQQEAVKFLNWFLNSPDAAVILGDVRSVPASASARQAAADAGKINPLATKGLELGLTSRQIPDNALESNSELGQIDADITSKVEYKKLTPEKAAEELVNKLTAKLDELKKAK